MLTRSVVSDHSDRKEILDGVQSDSIAKEAIEGFRGQFKKQRDAWKLRGIVLS